VAAIYGDIRRTYSAAIRGQLAIWLIGMVLSLTVLMAFQTPGLLLWMGPIALVRLMPYFGGFLGGGFTMAALLLSLPWPASLLPVIVVIVAQNIIGYLVEPRVLGRALQLSPALVLFAVLLGWKLGGVTGIVFCLPAVAVLQTLVEHRVRNGVLEPPLVARHAASIHEQAKPEPEPL
jgi:predicted PurR-regulated permease PerM